MAVHAPDVEIIDDTPALFPAGRTVKLKVSSEDLISPAEIPSLRTAATAGPSAMDAWWAAQPPERALWWAGLLPVVREVARQRLANLY